MSLRRWLTATFLCAISAGASAAQIFSFLGTVQVSGKFEPGDVKKLEDVLRAFDAPPPIFMVSQGGVLESALDMAPVIRQRAAKLRLNGLCVSACASVMLASHPRREARKGAVIAFHATDAVWLSQAMAEMRRLAAEDTAAEALVGDLVRRSEVALPALEERLRTEMRLAGMDPAMFDRASHATRQRLKHLFLDVADRRLDLDKEPATTCSYWVPDEHELAAMGVVFSGGYRRLPPDELAKVLKVPRSELLLSLDEADTQCVDRPISRTTPAGDGQGHPPAEPPARGD